MLANFNCVLEATVTYGTGIALAVGIAYLLNPFIMGCLSKDNKPPFHPNQISALGVGVTAIALFIYQISPLGGFITIATAYLTDYFDGRLSRKIGGGTIEGTLFDPLCDRLSFLIGGSYVAFNLSNPFVTGSYIANLIVGWTIIYSRAKKIGGFKNYLKRCKNGLLEPEKCEVDESGSLQLKPNSLGKAHVLIQDVMISSFFYVGAFESISNCFSILKTIPFLSVDGNSTVIAGGLFCAAGLGTIGLIKDGKNIKIFGNY